jgi:2,5-diamino-6-(ribosylamino)-4(3H)-pyrimidinone 5'-phosphate reductase
MTHYLRTCHDAILIGVGTAEADNPGLYSRLCEDGVSDVEGVGKLRKMVGLERQPRPFVLDPSKRWRGEKSENVFWVAREGVGRAPWWIVGMSNGEGDSNARRQEVEELKSRVGGVIEGGTYDGDGVDWSVILRRMAETGIRSVMVEGGAAVLNDLLRARNQRYITSVIVTIAPTYLGAGGVVVAPQRTTVDRNEARLRDVKWLPLGQDVVMAGRLQRGDPSP